MGVVGNSASRPPRRDSPHHVTDAYVDMDPRATNCSRRESLRLRLAFSNRSKSPIKHSIKQPGQRVPEGCQSSPRCTGRA